MLRVKDPKGFLYFEGGSQIQWLAYDAEHGPGVGVGQWSVPHPWIKQKLRARCCTWTAALRCNGPGASVCAKGSCVLSSHWVPKATAVPGREQNFCLAPAKLILRTGDAEWVSVRVVRAAASWYPGEMSEAEPGCLRSRQPKPQPCSLRNFSPPLILPSRSFPPH